MPPFGGAATVLKYLARSTHRAALSNHRLVEFADGRVTFRGTDYAHGGRRGTRTRDAVAFGRRFLWHVLPAGFVRVRHAGRRAHRPRQETRARCREWLGRTVPEPADSAPAEPDPIPPPVPEATVTATRAGPRCGAGRRVVIAEFPPAPPLEGIAVNREPFRTLDRS
jgi:Putative transposase